MKIDQTSCFTQGGWFQSATRESHAIISPKTRHIIGRVPMLTAEEIRATISHSQRAFQKWRHSTPQFRAEILTKLGAYLIEHCDRLAAIISLEQGKPHREAVGEVHYSADYLQCYAEEALRITRDSIQDPNPSKQLTVTRRPLGVVVAITPWNFPLAMLTRKMAAALAAGCTFIAKPAPETPLSALALGEACCAVGVPIDVVQIVTGDAEILGKEFMKSKTVRGVSFTGSTEVGKLLIKQSSDTVKKLTLELGGNAPCIICQDADIEKAVQGVILGKFRNAGQVCIAINRLLIHENIAQRFTEKLISEISKLTLYEREDAAYDIGPLINQAAVEKIVRLTSDAKQKGASLCYGPLPSLNPQSTLVKPCVLSDISPSMAIWHEEVFGPIVSIATFSNIDEAITLANNTDYGLAAYVYSSDLKTGHNMALELDFGMVGVNDTAISNARAPFGGIKQSGFGREGGAYGIAEYLELQYQSSIS